MSEEIRDCMREVAQEAGLLDAEKFAADIAQYGAVARDIARAIAKQFVDELLSTQKIPGKIDHRRMWRQFRRMQRNLRLSEGGAAT